MKKKWLVILSIIVATCVGLWVTTPVSAYQVIKLDGADCPEGTTDILLNDDGTVTCVVSPPPRPREDPEPEPEKTENGEGGACNARHFLGLRAWYDGLINDDCQMKEPKELVSGGNITSEAQGKAAMQRYVWTIVLNIATMALQIIGYLSVGFVIWGGYQYILAKGEPGKVAAGRKTITNAITGLIICMSASIIAGAISDIVSTAKSVDENFFVSIFNTALGWAGVVATIFIVYGGIQYVTSGGDPSKVTKAKNTIMYAAIGLVIAVLAAVIINTVLNAYSGS